MLILVSISFVAVVVEPAVARVQSWLVKRADASMLPRNALAPNVRFESDLCSFEGAAAYTAASERWHADAISLLQPYKTMILRCASLSAGKVSVRWRAEWDVPTLQWANTVAKLFRWSVVRFDVDPYHIAAFRWGPIATLFSEAFATGTLRLPCAHIEGSATLTFDSAGERIISHREKIDAVGLADAGKLLNRRYAQNAAEFLDVCRRPDSCDPVEWEAQVRSRMLAGVPGAGTLDIEPNADPNEGALALVAVLFISLAAAAWTADIIAGDSNSVAFGDNANSAICDEIMAELGTTSSQAYSQCVSDLF